MNARHRLKILIESALGVRFYRNLPHGIEYRVDIARCGFTPKIVLDVGANEGQAAMSILEAFPGAEIHCFEPVAETFERLRRNVGSQGCRCMQQAVGRAVGNATIHVTANSLTNSIVHKSPGSTEQAVIVTTVDAYAAERCMQSIDLLKIDTEGFELDVLAGAERCFAEQIVRFVLIEAGFHFSGHEHVRYEQIHEHLKCRGFELFGFYNQTRCWSGATRLRFADALFAHTSTVAD